MLLGIGHIPQLPRNHALAHNGNTIMVNTSLDTSNAARDPLLLMQSAFTSLEKGSAFAVSGLQMAAAAILMRHDNLVAMATKQSPVVSLLMLEPTPKNEARRVYFAALLELFTAKRMKKSDTIPGRHVGVAAGDYIAAHNAKIMAQSNSIRRALSLAVEVARAGLSVALHWDDAKKVFRVLPHMLYFPGDVPAGALADSDRTVLLDGATYKVVRGNTTPSIVASVAQVDAVAAMKAGRAKVKRGANETPSASDPSDMVKSLAVEKLETWSIDQLLSIAGKLLNQASAILGEGDKGMPVAYSDLVIDTRNALEAIVIFRDECKAEQAKRDAAAFNTSKKAA